MINWKGFGRSGRCLNSTHSQHSCFAGLRKDLARNSCMVDGDLNPRPPEYKAGMLTITLNNWTISREGFQRFAKTFRFKLQEIWMPLSSWKRCVLTQNTSITHSLRTLLKESCHQPSRHGPKIAPLGSAANRESPLHDSRFGHLSEYRSQASLLDPAWPAP